MEVEVLISIVDDISCELERIRETNGAGEEEWFQDNIVEAHDLLLRVKDLIGA